MDEKTQLLVSFGAAGAANCMPCFEHYHEKAKELGLTQKDIMEAIDIAAKVKNGAQTAMRNFIYEIMEEERGENSQSCCDNNNPSCC